MKVAVPREVFPGEKRVSLNPDAVSRLVKLGIEIIVQRGAGAEASHADERYEEAGASLVDGTHDLFAQADLVVKVHKPTVEEAGQLREGSAVVAFLHPHESQDLVEVLRERRITSFSMDLVPRTTKAQEMDALSSMSTLAGYKAVLLAAAKLGKILPMIVSAAGTIPPARALIIGAGVAGLQAIATARRLGAVVSAFDIRPATKEQVQSLGATFVEMELGQEQTEGEGGYAKELSSDSQTRALETVRKAARDVDIVITTALIPGKAAPRLITREGVQEMRPGAVIVDLAAEAGGNCELTKPDEEVVESGVTILGPLNVPASLPVHASHMYGRNVSAFLRHIIQEQQLHVDLEDPITGPMCITHDGRVVHQS